MRTTNRTTPRTQLAGAAGLSLALLLTSCADDSDRGDDALPAITAGTDGEETAPGDPARATEPDAGGEVTEPGSDERRETNSVVFDAIDLAEAEAGGVAVEVEYEHRPDSDGVWEIEVAVAGEEMELLVGFDGTEVLDAKSDGTLDSEESDGLAVAEVGVADAIRIALDEIDGTFDEAELEREGDGFVWEVEIKQGRYTTEVHIDVVSGDVVRVAAD